MADRVTRLENEVRELRKTVDALLLYFTQPTKPMLNVTGNWSPRQTTKARRAIDRVRADAIRVGAFKPKGRYERG